MLRLRPTTVTCQSGTRLHVHYNTHTNYKYKLNTIRNSNRKIKKYKVMSNNPHVIKTNNLGSPPAYLNNCLSGRCTNTSITGTKYKIGVSVCLLHFSMQINTSSALGRLSEFQPRADRPAYRNSAHCAQFCATAVLCYNIAPQYCIISQFSATILC